jgi:hypothetical protein
MSARDISWLLMQQVSRSDNLVIFMYRGTGKFWEPQFLAVLLACPGLYMDNFTFTFTFTSTSILTQSRIISDTCHPGDCGDSYCSDNCWFTSTSFFLCCLAVHLNETPEFPWNYRLCAVNRFVLCVFEVHNFYLRLQPF